MSSRESEAETRRKRIDPKLIAQGWKVAPEGSLGGPHREDKVAAAEWSTENLRDNATGSQGSTSKINQPTLMSLPLSAPGSEEQAEIVRRVKSFFALAKAFRSELTAEVLT